MEYLSGEKFNNSRSLIEKEIKQNNNNEKINQKYISGEVRIVTEQARYPLPTLSDLFNNSKYTLQPEFQRRRRWDDTKKSRLIESFIINVPVPPVFFYEADYASFEVMDGLQRITTIIDFYNNNFALTNLEEWAELNGKYYSELPSKIKEGIDRRYLSSIILLKESAKDNIQADNLKKLVFERLNSGGVKLTAQETRNALYDGPFNKLCIELSQNDIFKELWNIKNEEEINEQFELFEETNVNEHKLYKDMSDVELVVRFFAFRHVEAYTGRLDLFLDNFQKKANTFSQEILDTYKKTFIDTMTLSKRLFSDKAFRQYKEYRGIFKWTEPIRTIYDPMIICLMELQLSEKNLNSIDVSIEKLQEFYKSNIELFNGKKQSKCDIINRKVEILKLLLGESCKE